MFNIPNAKEMPDAVFMGTGRVAQTQLTTSSNLAWLLGELGLTVRFNVMLSRPVVVHEDFPDTPEAQEIARRLISDMATRMGMKNLSLIDEMLGEIARQDMFHPMEDWMQGLSWDGVDRISELASAVQTENTLWPVYLEKWLVQVADAVCGWRDRTDKFSLPYVLVLVGGQGVGKTRFLANLGGAWIKTDAELHLSSMSSKDHQIDALRHPMVELAELDGIFRKSDISHMKSFISRAEDSIREPYARRALVRPRMTAFCGSVNDTAFLVDPSGSRRFWPVEVDAIAWHLTIDWAQLWAQVFELWACGTDFELSSEQDALRAATSLESHTGITPEAEKVEAYYLAHKGNAAYPEKAMNRTDIMEMLFGKNRTFSPKAVADFGGLLLIIAGKHRMIDGKQRCWMFPFNEFATDFTSWPKINQIKSV